MKKKGCKECPWLVDNSNNKIIREHSIRHDKKHNCHLLIKGTNHTLWNLKKEKICKGINLSGTKRV